MKEQVHRRNRDRRLQPRVSDRAASFASLCPDGAFAHVTFEPNGEFEIANGDPFFDSEADPVFEHAAMHRPGRKAFFISYEGLGVSGALDGMPAVGERWKLQGEGAEEAAWRPGGWQLAAYMRRATGCSC